MALDMYLEMGGTRDDWERTKEILCEFGMERLPEHQANAIWYTLGEGEVFCDAGWGKRPRPTGEIIAEGDHGCNFSVDGQISFRVYPSMYDEAVNTIHSVLVKMTQETNMLFVLSFQYEDIRAIRDVARGFEWFWYNSR